MWDSLYSKVKAALAAALALDGAFIIAALTEQTDWHDALIACIVTDLPVLVAYLKTEHKTTA